MIERFLQFMDHIKERDGLKSDEQFAVTISMTRGDVAQLKRGPDTRRLPLHAMIALHKVHRLNLNWLITGSGPMLAKPAANRDGGRSLPPELRAFLESNRALARKLNRAIQADGKRVKRILNFIIEDSPHG